MDEHNPIEPIPDRDGDHLMPDRGFHNVDYALFFQMRGEWGWRGNTDYCLSSQQLL